MLRLLSSPAVRVVRPAVLRRVAVVPRVAAVAPRRWMAGHAKADAHAAPAYGSHGHGHGPAWETATQHERIEVRAAEIRAARRDMTLAGRRGDEPAQGEPTAEELAALREKVAKFPKNEEDVEFVMEQCADGIERPDFVPSRVASTRTIEIDGEVIVVPELHTTLEWVMSSPMDYHTFEEVPAIKEAPEHDAHEDTNKDE